MLGSASANFSLGVCYHFGKSVKKDIRKAIECYKTAASSGHLDAIYNLSIVYWINEEKEKAMGLLEILVGYRHELAINLVEYIKDSLDISSYEMGCK